jgi:2-isopropylmalate synthase
MVNDPPLRGAKLFIRVLSNDVLAGGQLVVCAFSGSHQDAIKKGFAARELSKAKNEDLWEVPYLPLDPFDIGRTYESIIRVNAQSGKGGAAWIILCNLHLDLPRGLQIAFSKIVQEEADRLSRELKPTEIIHLFEENYHLQSTPRFELVDYDISADRSTSPAPMPGQTQSSKDRKRKFKGVIAINGQEHHLAGVGNGAISSLANALNLSLGIVLDVTDYKEHAIGEGKEVKAATYIECTANGNEQQKVWGVGIHEDVVQASLMALLSAASSIADLPGGSAS